MDIESTVKITEEIPIETDLLPTVEELCASVCNSPDQIDCTLEQLLPQFRRYAENNFGCDVELSTFFTIEGHTSVEVKIKHFSQTESTGLAASVLQKDNIVPVVKHWIQTLAALLPLPYSICNRCDTKHKCLKCP